jgi:hypothetical protein
LAFLEAQLSSILVIANANGTLSTSAVGPVTSNIGSGIAVLSRSSDDPEAENSLGEDVEDSVDDDLGADLDLPSATGSTPDTVDISFVN